jgi:hypothetical protein
MKGNSLLGGVLMDADSRRERPFGVTVIIILEIVSLIYLGINFLLQDVTDWLWVIPPLPGILDVLAQKLRLPVVFLVGYQLLVVVGLWFLKRWAWFLLMIQLGMNMITELLLYFYGVPLYLYMVFSVLMVFYLNQREVQRAFEHKNPQPEAG